jgi:hypothetical protein
MSCDYVSFVLTIKNTDVRRINEGNVIKVVFALHSVFGAWWAGLTGMNN